MNSPTPTHHSEVLLIGAGAAGLFAARELARAGRQVTLVEAHHRIGGRVHTFTPPGFTAAIGAGAEFIHGPAPLTRALLREAGMTCQPAAGATYQLQNGQLQANGDFFAQLPLLLRKLQQLTHDLPLADFLARDFAGPEYAPLRAMATQFAEGYDAADTERVSAWGLRDEWSTGDASDSPRPVGGYGPLLHCLAEQAQAAGATLHLGTPVGKICWQPGAATVHSTTGATYHAQQVLCTVPLGVWQRPAGQPGHLRFAPELPTHRAAATQLGFGAVIKVVLDFQEAFWHDQLPALGTLFSEAAVPTWWSQLPDARPRLTGWLAGPAAQRLRTASTEVILELALASLAQVLAVSGLVLRARLCASYVRNWGAEPYAYGAYSYPTVGAHAARTALATPVANTLFFAGEGVYNGPTAGTVEAALVSGQAAAQAMLAAAPATAATTRPPKKVAARIPIPTRMAPTLAAPLRSGKTTAARQDAPPAAQTITLDNQQLIAPAK